MDLRKGKISKLYFKFLWPCVFSGMVTSVYSLVDMIVVGQYEGALGTAALSCLQPIWTFFCCIGMLLGLGGSVLFSNARGRDEKAESDRIFTSSLIALSSIVLIVWLIIIFFDKQLLYLFGATDETLMTLARRYMFWLKFGIPLYPFAIFLGFYIRADGNPRLGGLSVTVGGIFNIIADYVLTFPLDMGIEGAAIATVLGQFIGILILLSHFISRKNRIKLAKPINFIRGIFKQLAIGFPSFVSDISMGMIIIFFNNQIMHHFGTDELAVFGVAGSIFLAVQPFSYGIGNAMQPIIGENSGAKQFDRVLSTMKYGLYTSIIAGVCFFALCELIPLPLVKLYMDAPESVLAVAAPILRKYSVCFIFIPFNMAMTLYCQSIIKIKTSAILSILRGFVIILLFIYLIPAIFGANSLWFAQAATEIVIALLLAIFVSKYNKEIKNKTAIS